MAGKIKKIINVIIQEKSMGNPLLESSIKVKMIMKGIFPDKYDEASEDDAAVIEKLNSIAKEYNIKV